MNKASIREIRDASKRIKNFIHRTPVLRCSTLNRICKAELFFKCENFQKAGAFKIRGAANAVFALEEQQAFRGVATHSSGNHAAALALAARWRGIPAYVVMPENVPQIKKNAVAGYGAEIIFCEPTLSAREQGLAGVVERTGAAFIPPYNDHRVISGQGTAALELLEELGDLDVIMAPLGGGGLLSGTAIVTAAISPKTRVIGAEPKEADDALQSFRAGRIIPSRNPHTIADGLRTSLGDLTFPFIKALVGDIVTVSEEAIVEAMRVVWERMKIIIEPSAAVPLAAVLNGSLELPGARIGIILSGGNVDLTNLPFSKETV